MKHLKTKLMASVAMLMVATVMISSASFAWFTLSTQPEVTGITTNVATNGSLEIALADSAEGTSIAYTTPATGAEGDTGKNVKWGNLVNISSYFADNETNLKPVAYDSDDKVLQYPKFGDDGRLDALTALTPAAAKIGDGTAGEDGSIILLQDSETTPNTWAYRVDYFMRTNNDGNISLLLSDADDLDRGNGEAGAGSKIEGADEFDTDDIQVAIVVYDLGDDLEDGVAVSITGDPKVAFTTLLDESEFTEDTLFEAEANHIYLVQQYVYWDGASATNESMAEGGEVSINVQFTSDAELKSVFESAEGGE